MIQHFTITACCCRYVFSREESSKRARAESVPADSPDVKRNRNSTDSDALLKSVASLEQSNQVTQVVKPCASSSLRLKHLVESLPDC